MRQRPRSWNGFDELLIVKPRFSRRLAGLAAAMAGGSLVAVMKVNLPPLITVLLTALIAGSAFHMVFMQSNPGLRKTRRVLSWTARRGWSARAGERAPECLVSLRSWWSHSWFVVLRFAGAGESFSVLIPRDALDSDDFRRLRALLRCGYRQ